MTIVIQCHQNEIKLHMRLDLTHFNISISYLGWLVLETNVRVDRENWNLFIFNGQNFFENSKFIAPKICIFPQSALKFQTINIRGVSSNFFEGGGEFKSQNWMYTKKLTFNDLVFSR